MKDVQEMKINKQVLQLQLKKMFRTYDNVLGNDAVKYSSHHESIEILTLIYTDPSNLDSCLSHLCSTYKLPLK